MKKAFLAILLTGGSLAGFSQVKKKIDHTAYDEWKSIRNVQQSPTGEWVTYEVAPLEGDAVLFLTPVVSGEQKIFPRGKSARFAAGESLLVFLVEPQFDSIRRLKLAETPKDKLPKDSLYIYHMDRDTVYRIPDVKSYQVAEEGSWIAYHSGKDQRPECPETRKKRKKKKNPCDRPATSGTTLTLFNPFSGENRVVHNVTSYKINPTGTHVAYTTSRKGTSDSLSLLLLDLQNMNETRLIDKQLGIKQIVFDEDGRQYAFLASSDTNEQKNYQLYYGLTDGSGIQGSIDSTTAGMPAGWTVSESGSIHFSRDGRRLFLGTNTIVRPEPEDSLLESERARVDIWGTFDPRIQPQQLSELPGDEKRSYKAVFHLHNNTFVQLADEQVMNIRLTDHGNSDKALGIDDFPYQREATWEYPWKSDYYLVDLQTGSRELIKKGLGFTASLSPAGKFFVYYNGHDSCWYSIDPASKKEINMTRGITAVFASDNNGNPSLADDQGFIGWTMINGAEYCLVNSRYDIWALNPANPLQHFSPTGEKGKLRDIRYVYDRLDADSTYTRLEDNLFIGIDQKTKSESIYRVPEDGTEIDDQPLLTTNHRIVMTSKAEKSDRIIFRRMSFYEYPDLEKTDLSFENPVKFTRVNPQQEEYNWGTVEIVDWTSYEGRQLSGLLYKPEDFDSTLSYPMIVYFYEKYSDDLHNYYAPKPTASIVYPTEYVSNGYIVFIPDIEYTPGYPAKSAYDCIVSGTDYLIRRHTWIDSTRLGLQGQSWGGYQTAQLITMTNKYKAAMAGAPVSNMTSAYGGIRWGSGLSRMFQYERTQSRIGYTLWEKPELYIANSPVFGLPNVSTPLLIMSNDGDGAVPWYQGIELYMGLRRLGKPAWLLNYNGDEHNLTQLANKRDLSIRMRQFFDYYLLGEPMPLWMSKGVPATEKGVNYGLELENFGN